MAKVTSQNREHALFETLNEFIETREDTGAARLRPRSRSSTPYSGLLWLWNNVLKWAVKTWHTLTDEQKAWWNAAAPAQYRSGYNYYLFQWLAGAAGAGPLTVGGMFPIGTAYIGLPLAPYGVTGRWTVGHSMVGGSAEISG